MAVIRNRLGNDADGATIDADAPAQVGVVVVGEQRRVEAAGPLVRLARDREGTAVGEERLAGGAQLGAHGLAVVLLEPSGLEVERPSHEVDALAVPAEHARCRARVRVVEGVDEPPDGVRLDAHVVVEEREHLAARHLDPRDVAARESPVLVEGHDLHRGEGRGEQPRDPSVDPLSTQINSSLSAG